MMFRSTKQDERKLTQPDSGASLIFGQPEAHLDAGASSACAARTSGIYRQAGVAVMPEAEYERRDYNLSPDQAVRLLALANAIRSGDLTVRGHEEGDEKAAIALLADVGEELALQFGGGA
jgi:hypothetical protein